MHELGLLAHGSGLDELLIAAGAVAGFLLLRYVLERRRRRRAEDSDQSPSS